MPWWVNSLVGVTGATVAAWLALVIALALMRPHGALLGETLRLLPDMMRLLTRLAVDRSLPRVVRVRIWLLLAYLASPVDIIPDFIPVLGYADDAIVTGIVLRSVVRKAGRDVVREQWQGTADGFEALTRITGLGK